MQLLLALGHLLCLLATTSAALPSSVSRAAKYGAANNYTMRLPMRRRQPLAGSIPTKAQEYAQQHDALGKAVSSDDSSTATSSSAKPTHTVVKAPLNPYFREMAYGIKIWIGNPPQLVILDFDTGSSETWVSPQCGSNSWNPAYEDLCRKLGSYIPEQSETVIDINSTYPPQFVSYGSGEALLTFYKDSISFSDANAVSSDEIAALDTRVQFGLAKWSSGMMSGIFGAGYGIGYNQNYSGIIDEMYQQGLIRDKDIGVAVGSVDESNGEVLFGGIDMAKFSGPLHAIDMSKQFPSELDSYYRYWVNVTYIGVTQPGSCISIPITDKGFNHQFLPDTGTTMTYIPYDVYDALLRFFPEAVENYTYGTIVDCGHLNATGTIDFGFGSNFTIRVPYKEFIFQLEPGIFGDNNQTLCILGAVPSFDEFLILGDTFMRSTYALFRQQQHKIYFGQYSNCGQNIISTHGIGDFTGDCDEDGMLIVGSSEVDPLASSSSSLVSATTTAPPKRCTSHSTGTYTPPSSSSTTEDNWTSIPPLSSDTDTDRSTWEITVTSPSTTDDSAMTSPTVTSSPTDTMTDWDWSTISLELPASSQFGPSPLFPVSSRSSATPWNYGQFSRAIPNPVGEKANGAGSGPRVTAAPAA
ncbi:aspartic peptidase domain-containing protein [Cladorrhinum sp. PSN259]|nr:aspartic peptidase domain-containing protein [Cladorrhinum sp. PSN259]